SCWRIRRESYAPSVWRRDSKTSHGSVPFDTEWAVQDAFEAWAVDAGARGGLLSCDADPQPERVLGVHGAARVGVDVQVIQPTGQVERELLRRRALLNGLVDDGAGAVHQVQVVVRRQIEQVRDDVFASWRHVDLEGDGIARVLNRRQCEWAIAHGAW